MCIGLTTRHWLSLRMPENPSMPAVGATPCMTTTAHVVAHLCIFAACGVDCVALAMPTACMCCCVHRANRLSHAKMPRGGQRGDVGPVRHVHGVPHFLGGAQHYGCGAPTMKCYKCCQRKRTHAVGAPASKSSCHPTSAPGAALASKRASILDPNFAAIQTQEKAGGCNSSFPLSATNTAYSPP